MTNTQFGVDWEQRVNFTRLREDRLGKTRRAMEQFELDALLLFKPPNIRYATGARGVESYWDISECALVLLENNPTVYLSAGIGLDAPWLEDHLRPARNLHGEGEEGEKTNRKFVEEISDLLSGVKGRRLGVDILYMSIHKPLVEAGFEVLDAGPTLTQARILKTPDEIALLKVAAAMNDAGLYAARESIHPGAREFDVSASLLDALRSLGSDWYIRGVICSGDHTSPQYKTVGGTDRIIQPGDLVLVDSVHSYMSYWSDVARTFLCGDKPSSVQRNIYSRCHDMLLEGVELVKPGNTTADVVERWQEIKSTSPVHVTGVGHGIGTTLHEIPIVHDPALETPTEFVPGMVVALEVYASQEKEGVRLEQNLVVTDEGYEIISKLPFEENLL